MKSDKEKQLIKIIKGLVSNNLTNKELSINIDKYFIPDGLDKKTNAEVSTPYKLRQEMLDKIPLEFWTKENKVFEPCCGKGGFIVDIIGRFMEGLKNKIVNEKKRYKVIVEKCLYWSDINPTNIFICKLLVDPYNEYKLNYNEGNTLELNIKNKWDLDGFDAVIGNPPYQGTGRKKLYINFIDYAIENLKSSGKLLYITPQLSINYLMGATISQKTIAKLYDIKFLTVSDKIKNTYFKNVGSDFTYYYLVKSNYENETTIIYKNNKKDKIKLIFNTIISLDDKANNAILDKVLNITENQWNRRAARIDKNLKLIRTSDYPNTIIYKIKTNTIEYRYTNKTHKDFNKYKVLYPTLGNNYVIDKNRNLFPGTSFVVYLPCKNLKECANILKLKDSNLFKYLIKNFSNHRSPIDYIWRNLSKPKDFDIDINAEDDIYRYFKLTRDEINLVEDTINCV